MVHNEYSRLAANRVLAALDADPAHVENRSTVDIEGLLLADIKDRLFQLGMRADLPSGLRRVILKSSSPVAEFLDRLSCEEDQSIGRIQRTPISEVTPNPRRFGINYRAGLTDNKSTILSDHFLFKTLSSQQIDRLAPCIVTKKVKRGVCIFAKGDAGSSLFAIVSGVVRIVIPSVDGHDAIFNVLFKGDIFGEIALLDGKARTADAVAVEDCELFVIERRDFLPILRSEPDIALALIEVLCGRLRRTTTQAEYLMYRGLPCRLAAALLQLSTAGDGRRNTKVAVTQRELGSFIGMSRESTNRQLRNWEERGWVRLDHCGISIISCDALISVAEGG